MHHLTIGDVKTNGGDTGDGRESSSIDQVQESQKSRDEARQPDGPDRTVQLGVDPVQVLGSRHGSITRESIDHTRVGCDRGVTAEELSQQQDAKQQHSARLAHSIQKDLSDGVSCSGVQDVVNVLNTKSQSQQVGETGHKGDSNGHQDANRSCNIGILGLLRHMSGSIITSHGELGLQETQEDNLQLRNKRECQSAICQGPSSMYQKEYLVPAKFAYIDRAAPASVVDEACEHK